MILDITRDTKTPCTHCPRVVWEPKFQNEMIQILLQPELIYSTIMSWSRTLLQKGENSAITNHLIFREINFTKKFFREIDFTKFFRGIALF